MFFECDHNSVESSSSKTLSWAWLGWENEIGSYELPTSLNEFPSNGYYIDDYETETLYSYQLNQSETINEGYKNRIIDNIQLELHIPLYKLWK